MIIVIEVHLVINKNYYITNSTDGVSVSIWYFQTTFCESHSGIRQEKETDDINIPIMLLIF